RSWVCSVEGPSRDRVVERLSNRPLIPAKCAEETRNERASPIHSDRGQTAGPSARPTTRNPPRRPGGGATGIRSAVQRVALHAIHVQRKELSPQMLDRTVYKQTECELGLVPEIDAPGGIDIVAGARYYVHADDGRCEFAITVADGWQGVGLASLLMRECPRLLACGG